MNILKRIYDWFFSRQATPYWLVLVFDCITVVAANLIVYTIYNGATATARVFWDLVATLLVYLIPYIVGFKLMKTYAGIIRYASFIDLYRIGTANAIGIFILEALRLTIGLDRWFVTIHFRELVFGWLLATFAMCMVRIFIKFVYDVIRSREAHRRVFIYGTKAGGLAIAKSIRMETPARFHLRGFVSDSDDMPGHFLQGVRVYHNDKDLIAAMRKERVTTLIVSPLKAERFTADTAMADMLFNAGISVYSVNLAQPWDGRSDISTSQLHEVEIEDLLPRNEIQVDLKAVEELLHGRRILITGSAGSIGAEMVRQVAQWEPSELLLIDQAETPQHDIRLMMARDYPDIKVQAIVASITDKSLMEYLFENHRPEYVFHAAAYKHVPMMEDNPSEAVLNNVIGTKVIADMAVKYGVKKFVMISTDKAVNPTNVMGCSKRVCEIYVQALDHAIKEGTVAGETQFVTTRFGNVLGSNGSVIPLFKEQIRKGGPVTVTHPEIIRFFMLIPEACKLVLEAGTMGHGGEIFVFDMGKPVRIADLARRMIQLSGAHNVEIQFTGLRDGEKLYEEVLSDEEHTMPTFNSKIKIAQVRVQDYAEVCRQIEELQSVALRFDNMATVAVMKAIVPEYKSKNSIYEQLDNQEQA